MNAGHIHPLTVVERDALTSLIDRGFTVFENSNELVTINDAFDSLNVPNDHPARDQFDTYYITDSTVLRPHTTANYLSLIKNNNLKPPFRIAISGRTFRNEATDRTHNNVFHQIDALAIGADISLANLIDTLHSFISAAIGRDVSVRLRPSYFPFVEPGYEIDIFEDGKWIEVLGCGMVHPKVMKNLGIDSNFTGFAFGVGVERLLKLRCEIPDIRAVLESDYRFLAQTKIVK